MFPQQEKKIVKRLKGQTTDSEKIFTNHICNEKHTSKICNELSQLYTKNTTQLRMTEIFKQTLP